ncbi:MAG: excinuclease ABC subunit A [Lautropia sp.]|nr:excinuclease ABC subunit A [Lautropia sp.]
MTHSAPHTAHHRPIRIRGARQNNLKNLSLDIPTGQLVVVTGVSGSGKSSLVFDTLYAEGQRRYVETFSAYARQFLDRMDRPQVDSIDGVPPAIAIDQTNPVRTSRSTVGTMTELNDHLKLLMAHAATLYCRQCAQPVRIDDVGSIVASIHERAASAGNPRLLLCFPVMVPAGFDEDVVLQQLSAQGYTRIHRRIELTPGVDDVADTTEGSGRGKKGKGGKAGTAKAGTTAKAGQSAPAAQTNKTIKAVKGGRTNETAAYPNDISTADSQPHGITPVPLQLIVVADRFRAESVAADRLAGSVEAALAMGRGRLCVIPLDDDGRDLPAWHYSARFACASCDIDYSPPSPSLFSFNSPLGACETCRGFGRVIGLDLDLVIPDPSKSLAEGAVKPWQTPSFKEAQHELMKYGKKAGIDLHSPWAMLAEADRRWVLDGAPDWTGKWNSQWYGVRNFFNWLESKAYKMHIRVLLSKYRSYTTCPSCRGARLKPEALLWRIGSREDARVAFENTDISRTDSDPGSNAEPGAGRYERFMPMGTRWTRTQLDALPGLTIHDIMLLPIDRLTRLMENIALPAPLDEATELLMTEIRARLRFLHDVGLDYLTLDRQSRTLSGGEVQRINLTTALGTSLVNTLFILDEPSIGLHPRDMDRIIGIMHRLKDAGNSLVVVEHDPQVMFAAERIIDIGPGPGERGGEIVFDGPASALPRAQTLTADYLAQRKHVASRLPQPIDAGTPRLRLEGVSAHNLKHIDVEIPLARLVCLTGVSGSGKSTLMQDVLLPALLKARGEPTEAPGPHRALIGSEMIENVVFVDQSPIGKTTRSNPVSYVGAFDLIRKQFANAELSRERGYTAGTFSFNTGDGRCPTCHGNGFEHVEMQFLSDVYLRCPDCDGKRFRPEIQEVRVSGRSDGTAMARTVDASIVDVLDMTVSQAAAFFGNTPDIARRLQPLIDVGLDYLKLGQPVPTLSGGEAQRLKLAGFLADAAEQARKKGSNTRNERRLGGTLHLFDEPTTGLHFDDIAKLLRALRALQQAGHSVLVIEHNLDLIAAADWLIDLGPGGGEHGGRLVASGTPDEVAANPASFTGQALRTHDEELARRAGWARDTSLHEAPPPWAPPSATKHDDELPAHRRGDAIRVHGAREHNLKNIDVDIPRDQMTVITGVSGSGKSTLAFDVVFGEGQRRYLESLNAYARQFVQPASRPDVDGIYGIPPTVAIEQRTSRGGRKSTVATLTEIHHFLRLLYQKVGTQYCPNDGTPIEPQSFDAIAARIMRRYRGRHVGLLAPLVRNRKGIYTDLAKWAKSKGYPALRVDGRFLPTDEFPRIDRYIEHTIELPVGDVFIEPKNESELRAHLHTALQHGKGVVMLLEDVDRLKADMQADLNTVLFSTKRACSHCGTSYPELDPRSFSFNAKHGWCTACLGTGLEVIGRIKSDELTPGLEGETDAGVSYGDDPCPVCAGRRLNPVALNVKIGDESIATVTARSVLDARTWVDTLEAHFDSRQKEIARGLLSEISNRLQFLTDVGLGYLTLDRSAPSLSGGEAQRIRLAGQLGSNLQGVCYVLDEPTIGLHPRDNLLLLDTLDRLRNKGNTLLVVEHDEETIARADHLIDIGPGAGRLGGQIIATGTLAEITHDPDSLTGRFLREPPTLPTEAHRPVDARTPSLELRGARLHNLQSASARIPLKRLTVVTGVSGSGKSTFARDVLLDALQRRLGGDKGPLPHCDGLSGWEGVQRVLEVDQTPIGKTPRSTPATYVGFWDAIRRLFADTAEARMRGYTASRFSFNTTGGRCPACEGQGVRTIEMNFLPDVRVLCDVCDGGRFDAETNQAKLNGKSISDVLAMTVDEALGFFAPFRSIAHPLQLLQDVGLGYLTLGQQSPTLSGGEAQRIKLVTELTKVRSLTETADPLREAKARAMTRTRARKAGHQGEIHDGGTFYVLDEPTVGLHMADIEKLVQVMHRLTDAGNTVLVIEHNQTLWAEADWIIDIGPEGGTAGGRVVAEGSPRQLAARGKTHTSRMLAAFFKRHPAGRQ